MFELKVFVDPAEFCWAGQPVRLRPKERMLLCRLAFATGSSLSSRELAAEFLDRGSSGTAADTLRKHVSNFRAAVRQVAGAEAAQRLLLTKQSGHGTVYRLNLEPASIDAAQFIQLVDAGQRKRTEGLTAEAAADFTNALALWRQQPLRDAAGWHFARTMAKRLDARRRTARIELAEIRFAEARQREVIGDLRQLAEESPADSQVWELLIRCLWRDGRDGNAADTCKQAIDAFHGRGLNPALLRRLQAELLTGALSR
ncbi:MAG TPA: BTAD domain-containing putative transcriptional regulator [Streptosporangiaceae bacterium]|jgi:DNA-binding SARP family transcriptional activator